MALVSGIIVGFVIGVLFDLAVRKVLALVRRRRFLRAVHFANAPAPVARSGGAISGERWPAANQLDWTQAANAPPSLGPVFEPHEYVKAENTDCCRECGGGALHGVHHGERWTEPAGPSVVNDPEFENWFGRG